METLHLKKTKVSDLSPLRGLRNLKQIFLNDSPVSAKEALALRKSIPDLLIMGIPGVPWKPPPPPPKGHLRFCGQVLPLNAPRVVCNDPEVQDLRVLWRFSNLKVVDLRGAGVPEVQSKALERAVPGLEIIR